MMFKINWQRDEHAVLFQHGGFWVWRIGVIPFRYMNTVPIGYWEQETIGM